MLYSTRVMDTYMDTWPMKPSFIGARTRPLIGGFRSTHRVKSISSRLQIMQSAGRIEISVWMGSSGLRPAGPRAPRLDNFRFHAECSEFLFPGRLLDGRE